MQSKTDTTKLNSLGERLSGNGRKHGSSGGGRGIRHISQRSVISEDTDEPKSTTLSKIPVRYRSFAQVIDGQIVHKLVIHSDYDIDDGRIDLSIGTEDSTEQIIIKEANPGIARDNTITGLKILSNRPNIVYVKFADNMKYSIILEAYEIK